MNNHRWVKKDETKQTTPGRKKIRKPRSQRGPQLNYNRNFRPYNNMDRGPRLNYNQLDALKRSTNLPISIIRNFHMHIDMNKITKTTPIEVIVRNKFLPWNNKVLLNKKDVRMIHTKYFNLKWDYYRLTIEEPDKCNISIFPKLNWDEKAIEKLGVNIYCDKHLMFILKKYPHIKWDWVNATRKISLETIVANPSFPWDVTGLMRKLDDKSNSSLLITAIITLPRDLINWKNITELVTWKVVAIYPHLPWDFKEKHCCACGHPCPNFIPLWALRKLKHKPLNWHQITINVSFKTIYENRDIPWDNDAIINRNCENIPYWFIQATDYKWNMKNITKRASWDDVLKYPNLKWNTEELSKAESKDPPLVQLLARYSDLKWDWDKYSGEFSYDDILNYSHLPWKWDIITKRNNIPFDFVMMFPSKNWKYESINAENEDSIMVKSLQVLRETFTKDLSMIIYNKLHC